MAVSQVKTRLDIIGVEYTPRPTFLRCLTNYNFNSHFGYCYNTSISSGILDNRAVVLISATSTNAPHGLSNRPGEWCISLEYLPCHEEGQTSTVSRTYLFIYVGICYLCTYTKKEKENAIPAQEKGIIFHIT